VNRFQLRHGAPLDRVVAKVQDHIDEWVGAFIRCSPFVVLATADDRGLCDVSPRGGEPGFVRVLGRRQLVMPDLAGNNLFQSLGNLDRNPGMALLFFIPGVEETARVNGSARVVSKSELAAEIDPSQVRDLIESPRVLQAVLVEVHEAYYHCGRSVRAGGLWDADRIRGHREAPPLPKRPVRREETP